MAAIAVSTPAPNTRVAWFLADHSMQLAQMERSLLSFASSVMFTPGFDTITAIGGAWFHARSAAFGMRDRDATVEHEAFPAPSALGARHVLQVFQYAALEVVDFRKTFVHHEGRGFLTPYPAGAEHGHLAMLLRVEVLAHVFGQFGEMLDPRIGRARERAKIDLIAIARIQ